MWTQAAEGKQSCVHRFERKACQHLVPDEGEKCDTNHKGALACKSAALL
jgi:hypothetical protein